MRPLVAGFYTQNNSTGTTLLSVCIPRHRRDSIAKDFCDGGVGEMQCSGRQRLEPWDHSTSQMAAHMDTQSQAVTAQFHAITRSCSRLDMSAGSGAACGGGRGWRATRRGGENKTYTKITQAVVLCSLAMVASGSGRGRAHTAQAPALKSWFVVHGPPNEEESVFGYVADQDAMAPAMTLTFRPRGFFDM